MVYRSRPELDVNADGEIDLVIQTSWPFRMLVFSIAMKISQVPSPDD